MRFTASKDKHNRRTECVLHSQMIAFANSVHGCELFYVWMSV